MLSSYWTTCFFRKIILLFSFCLRGSGLKPKQRRLNIKLCFLQHNFGLLLLVPDNQSGCNGRVWGEWKFLNQKIVLLELGCHWCACLRVWPRLGMPYSSCGCALFISGRSSYCSHLVCKSSKECIWEGICTWKNQYLHLSGRSGRFGLKGKLHSHWLWFCFYGSSLLWATWEWIIHYGIHKWQPRLFCCTFSKSCEISLH